MSAARRKLGETDDTPSSKRFKTTRDAVSAVKKRYQDLEDEAAPVKVLSLPKDIEFKGVQLKESEQVVQARIALHKAITTFKQDVHAAFGMNFSLVPSSVLNADRIPPRPQRKPTIKRSKR
jgi:hypothetical protein